MGIDVTGNLDLTQDSDKEPRLAPTDCLADAPGHPAQQRGHRVASPLMNCVRYVERVA